MMEEHKWKLSEGVCLARLRFCFDSLILKVDYPQTCLPLQNTCSICVSHTVVILFGQHTFAPTYNDYYVIFLLQINSHLRETLISCCAVGSLLIEWCEVQTTPFPVRLRVTDKEKGDKELCVSHSKVGVIEGQGGIQQNGSRTGKLQVR